MLKISKIKLNLKKKKKINSKKAKNLKPLNCTSLLSFISTCKKYVIKKYVYVYILIVYKN